MEQEEALPSGGDQNSLQFRHTCIFLVVAVLCHNALVSLYLVRGPWWSDLVKLSCLAPADGSLASIDWEAQPTASLHPNLSGPPPPSAILRTMWRRTLSMCSRTTNRTIRTIMIISHP